MAADPIKIRKSARKEHERQNGRSGRAQGNAGRDSTSPALRDSEERFRATFEQAAVGIAHTTTEGRVLQVNVKLCEILGYTDTELLGMSTRELTHPDDRDKQDRLRLDVLSGRRSSFSAEKRFLRKDGSGIWINRTVTLARRPTTGEMYLIQVIEDISERKRTDARFGRLTRARRVMAECNHILVHAADEAGMLESMCRVVVESGGYKMAWVGLATGDPARPIHPAAHAGFGEDSPMSGDAAWSPDGRYRGFMSEVMESGEPHIARNILQDPAHARRLVRAQQRGFQSSIALPLKGDGRILGAIAMYAAEPDAFDDEELTLLRALSDDIAFGIASLRERGALRNAEAALRESEQRFRETFEQAAVGITRVDLNGVLVDANQKFCDMLGYGKDQLLGKHIRDITHPDDYGKGAQYRAELTHRVMKAAAGEKRFVRRNGTALWARRTMSTACDASGKPLYVISVVEDITERKELERQFELTFNQAAVGMTQTGLDGRLLQVNQKYADMLGYTRDELYRMRIDDLTHPEDRAETAGMRQQLLERKIDSASSEKRLVCKDGRVIWVHRTFSLARDASGAPLHYIAVLEDITERKRAEAERAQLAAIVEGSEDAIISTTLERKILSWNAAAERMFGYTAAEVLGRIASFLIPADREAEAAARRKRLDPAQPAPPYDTVRVARDGRRMDVSVSQSPMKDAAGRVLGVSLVFRDISERKQAEERYRATFDNAPIGILHTDIGGDRILHANPKLCEMLGYTRDELLERVTDDIIPPDFRGKDRGKYRDQMLSGALGTYSSERKLQRKDGSAIWVYRTVSLVRDAAGRPQYFIRIIEDITERTLSARLRAMEHAVTRILAEAATVGEAVPGIIRTICEGLDWACGFHWAWDRPSELLLCREYWCVGAGPIESFVRASREMVNEAPAVPLHPTGGGVVRQVWNSGAPVWVPDVARAPDFRRGPSAVQAGLHGAFAFPILTEGRPGGVMEFFSHEIREPDEALLQIMHAIGSQIGQFIQRKGAEAALHESEEQFKQLANNIPQVFWITDVGHRETIYISPAAESMTGRPLWELHEDRRALIRCVHEEDRRSVYEARRAAAGGGYDQTYRVVRPDGTTRWVHDRAFPVNDESGAVYRIAGIAEDVTDRKFAEERLMQLAHYDVLTNLPNRVLFYDRLRQVLAQAKRNQWIVGVMFVDLDRFKNVNDTLGHAVGDDLLQQVSGRLTRSVRSGDTVGRLGGDEFAIVLSSLSNAQDANLVAQKLLASFKEPFRLGGSEVYVTASIGLTLYPEDSTDQDALIRNADSAMYRAKEAGRNSYQFYTPEMNSRALEVLSMETSLRGALDRGEFLLYYQPKASIADGRIVGVEALLRWRHPERGLVSPAEFMFVLEETGLIVQVGDWVLRRVCEQIKAWERAGHAPLPVAVNLSARQFNAKEFGPAIGAVLREQGVDPGLIELEITESSLMTNTEDAVRTLEYLSALGVGLSIDDFGTGYSSLSYLKRFPLDALKIDRSFIRDITTDSDDATITRAVISMAHSLGLKVIAEGVETEEQFAFLAEYGCDEIQGYYFSYPLEVGECGDWITQKRRLPRRG